MQVYLASKYHEHPRMREFRTILQEHGIDVTSRWIEGEHEAKEGRDDHDLHAQFAREDLEDIDAADAVVMYQPKDIHGQGRGGRHVEFGYAFARAIPIIIIGDRENVFNYLEGVDVVSDIMAAITLLKDMQEQQDEFEQRLDDLFRSTIRNT